MIVDIVEILEKIAQGISNKLSPEEVENLLTKERRYDKNIIATAYSWVYEKTAQQIIERKLYDQNSKSIRVLSDDEIAEIGLDNYNYLLHFYNLGLLSNEEIDFIIEQIKIFPRIADSEHKIKLLILSQFLQLDNSTLPGSRLLLYSSDTIN